MKRWEAIREITRILLEPVIERTKIERITKVLQEYLAVSRCVILELREEDTQYEITTAVPHSNKEHGIGETGTVAGKGAIEEVLKTKKPLLIPDAKSNPLTAYMHHWAVIKGINAVLFVPIMINHDFEAIMVYDATNGKSGFNQEEVRFAIDCATYIEELFTKEKETYRLQQRAQHKEQLDFSLKLCADLAHLARNPLTSVGGFTRRTANLAREFVKVIPQQEELLAVINKIIENLEIIQEDASKVESVFKDITEVATMEQQLNLIDADLGVLITTVLAELKNENPDFRCQLKIDPVPPLEIDTEKVGLALKHILTNAFEEASKQQDQARQEIWINLRLKSNKAEITIVNYGELAQDIINHIFKPFVSTKTLGSGLGLPIAKKLIVLNGGELTIKSDKDKVICRIIFPCDK